MSRLWPRELILTLLAASVYRHLVLVMTLLAVEDTRTESARELMHLRIMSHQFTLEIEVGIALLTFIIVSILMMIAEFLLCCENLLTDLAGQDMRRLDMLQHLQF